MYTMNIPFIVKSSNPVVTYGLLALVGAAIGFVAYMMFRHQHRTRKAQKHGRSPHTGHHGNH